MDFSRSKLDLDIVFADVPSQFNASYKNKTSQRTNVRVIQLYAVVSVPKYIVIFIDRREP